MLRQPISRLLRPSSLSLPHQDIIARLGALVTLDQPTSQISPQMMTQGDWSVTPKARRAALRDKRPCGAFVASAVCGSTVEAERCATLGVAHHLDVAVGVNFELHRATQWSSRSCGCVAGSVPLQGLLKGCAEQNAIGSFGAGGRSYHTIRHVFLYSHSIPPHGKMIDDGTQACTSTSGHTDAHMIRTPCAECWRHMCGIAAMVHRCTSGSEELQLHVVTVDSAPSASSAPSICVMDQEERTTPSNRNFCWDPSLWNLSQERGDIAPAVSFVLADPPSASPLLSGV
ncbi:GPI-anchored surface protein, putative [Bodo saltans]|uniref:GPI-anchored surface protein, putative n=1 Tax=Bodo saltans TaxID=75058 RepID=A0A0S4J0A7_BODSA|nr:GPI-anchored surface protein, putative [Bodo saltans]|eukprot:CUG33355.1 GPI-anchored surface protein, putative [Bodo saltans]